MTLDDLPFLDIQRSLRARVAAAGETEGAVFFVGDEAGVIPVPASLQAQPGEVYVHRTAGGNLEVTAVLNPYNVALSAGLAVVVGKAPNSNQTVILRAAVQAGVTVYRPESAIGVGPHARQHEWEGGDTPMVDLRQLTAWMLAPQMPPAWTLRVLGGLYQDGDALKWRVEGNTADLSGFRPGVAGQARWLAVGFDPAGAALSYTPGAAFAMGAKVEDDLAGLSIPDLSPTHYTLGVVYLYNGQTAVDWPHLRRPLGNAVSATIALLDRALTDDAGDVLTDDAGSILWS